MSKEIDSVKNILLLTSKTSLKSELEEKDKNIDVLLREKVVTEDELRLKVDLLLIDGELISHKSISDIRTIYPSIKIMFIPHGVKSSVALANIGVICSGYRVKLLRENMTTNQIADEVMNELNGLAAKKKGGRVVGLFGTHSGAGLSTTVMNIARVLASETTSSIAVLSLNPWDTADYFYDYSGLYLNEIKTELATKNISKERLKDVMNHRKRFWQLAGNKDIKLQRYFTTEEIEYLITLARDTFDIVLIDAGCHFDNACYGQAFTMSDMKFLVTNQDIKGFRNYWSLIRDQILRPVQIPESDYMLIVNNYIKNYNLISDKSIADELGMYLLATIPSAGDLGNISLRQHKSLYDMADTTYKTALHVVVDSLITSCELQRSIKEVAEVKKRGLLSFLGKKKVDEE